MHRRADRQPIAGGQFRQGGRWLGPFRADPPQQRPAALNERYPLGGWWARARVRPVGLWKAIRISATLAA